MRFVEDVELNLTGPDDAFDSVHYSNTLREIILAAPSSPFTIGLFGEWGSGKSSIVKTAQNQIEEACGAKYHFVTYDAWKYAKDSFRRMFLLRLSDSLGLEAGALFSQFYESTTTPVRYTRKYNKWVIAAVVLLFGAAVAALMLPIGADWKMSLQAAFTAAALLVTVFANLVREYVTVSHRPALSAPEQFESCLDEILDFISKKKGLSERLKRLFKGEFVLPNIEKLVIVIDNIDRCDAETAYEVLSDLKNFLGKDNVVFVIPVDDKALRSHIKELNKYGDKEADEFLRKLFNNTLKIKPYKSRDLFDFSQSLSARYGLGLSPETIDVVAKEYATNPRRIVQFMNSLTSELAYFRHRVGEQFARFAETQIAMALIIREEWPDIYAKLSMAVFKIKELEQLYALCGKNERAKVFFRKTHPYTRLISDVELDLIFSNKTFNKVPQAVLEDIDNRKTGGLEEFLKANAYAHTLIVDELIGKLDKSVGRNIAAAVADAFNALVFVDSWKPLSQDQHRRIYGILNADGLPATCLFNTDDPARLSMYIDELEKLGITYLCDSFSSVLGKLIPDDYSPKRPENPILAPQWSALVKAIAKNATSERLLKATASPLFYVLRDEGISVLDITFGENRLNVLVRPEYARHLIEEYDVLGKEICKEIVAVSRANRFSDESLVVWTRSIAETVGTLQKMEVKEMLRALAGMRDVLNTKVSCLVDHESLDIIINAAFSVRRVQRSGQQPRDVSMIDELAGEPEAKKVVVEWLLASYGATSGKSVSGKKLLEYVRANPDIEHVFVEGAKRLVHQGNFGLFQFHEFFSQAADLSEDLLELLGKIIKTKNANKEYEFNEGYARQLIERCLSVLARSAGTEEAKVVSAHLSKWIKDSRINKLVAALMADMPASQIALMPTDVQRATFKKICEGDLFDYADSSEILAAISGEAEPRWNKKIEKVIVSLLSREETARKGLELLTKIKSFEGMVVSYLVSTVSDLKQNEELAELAGEALTNLENARRDEKGTATVA